TDEVKQQRQSVSITSRRQVNIDSTHGRIAEHIPFERLALDEEASNRPGRAEESTHTVPPTSAPSQTAMQPRGYAFLRRGGVSRSTWAVLPSGFFRFPATGNSRLGWRRSVVDLRGRFDLPSSMSARLCLSAAIKSGAGAIFFGTGGTIRRPF